jgi:K+:H+ antiporter
MLNLVTLVLQLSVVLVACRLTGDLFLKIRQPRVNGEMFAGILLGPTLLGRVAPHASSFLFPSSTLGFLNALGQLGVVLFMFMAGLEIDPAHLKGHGRAASASSLVSIVAPFLLAYPLALYLYPRVSSPSVNFTHFALFVGAATSITAFPMLARILSERSILTSRLGLVSITCAATAGVATWCVLSYIVMIIKNPHAGGTLVWTLAGIVAFGLAMFCGVRPLLLRFDRDFQRRGAVGEGGMAMIMILVLAAGVCTGYLGLHPLFGAFLVGMIMPKDQRLVRYILERLHTITLAVLLPLYFAFSGIRTNLGAVHGAAMWMMCAVIVFVAVLGKAVAPMLAAWASGMPLRESAGLGALLNTRGLIALVVLNIGLDLKVISVALFSMMVVMALVNTVMTTWLLDMVCPARLIRRSSERSAAPLGTVAPVEAEAEAPAG